MFGNFCIQNTNRSRVLLEACHIKTQNHYRVLFTIISTWLYSFFWVTTIYDFGLWAIWLKPLCPLAVVWGISLIPFFCLHHRERLHCCIHDNECCSLMGWPPPPPPASGGHSVFSCTRTHTPVAAPEPRDAWSSHTAGRSVTPALPPGTWSGTCVDKCRKALNALFKFTNNIHFQVKRQRAYGSQAVTDQRYCSAWVILDLRKKRSSSCGSKKANKSHTSPKPERNTATRNHQL